jgi:hypothetical protein
MDMKNIRNLLLGTSNHQERKQTRREGFRKDLFRLLGVATVASVLSAGVASASSVVGKVKFLGTMSEDSSGGAYSARLHVRVSGTCDSDTSIKDRWVEIRSGPMDGIFAHNSVNMRNAYSTLLSALLSGNSVVIDELPNCSTTSAIPLALWVGRVGLVPDAPVAVDGGTHLVPVGE